MTLATLAVGSGADGPEVPINPPAPRARAASPRAGHGSAGSRPASRTVVLRTVRTCSGGSRSLAARATTADTATTTTVAADPTASRLMARRRLSCAALLTRVPPSWTPQHGGSWSPGPVGSARPQARHGPGASRTPGPRRSDRGVLLGGLPGVPEHRPRRVERAGLGQHLALVVDHRHLLVREARDRPGDAVGGH